MVSDRDTADRGVLYYAVGARYLREAERSAAAFKALMPGLRTALVSNGPADPKLFDVLIEPPAGLSVKRQKMQAILSSPFERTLYADTDTLPLAPVWEIFDVLDRYDAAMTLAPGYSVTSDSATGLDREVDGVPSAYPCWNAGLIAYVKSEAWQAVVRDWAALHETGLEGAQDQPPLRVAAYRSSARIAPLPYAYNYRLIFPGGVRGTVKLLHGRDPDLSQTARAINRTSRMRATVPQRYLQTMVVHGDTPWAGSIRKRIRRLLGR